MLSALTVFVLTLSLCLRWVFSKENLLAVVLVGLGTFVLAPLAIGVTALRVALSSLTGVVPVAGDWAVVFGSFTGGAYGVPNLVWLTVAVVLWFVAIFQFGEEVSDADGGDAGTADPDDGDKSDASRSGDVEELTDIRGVGPHLADRLQRAGFRTVDDICAASKSELAEVPGIASASAARIKSQVSDVDTETESRADRATYSRTVVTDRTQTELIDETGVSPAEPLTSIPGIDATFANALHKAGYNSVDDIREASISMLAGVVGSENAARIKDAIDSSNGTERTEQNGPSQSTETESSSIPECDSDTDTSTREDAEIQPEQIPEINGIDEADCEALARAGYTTIEGVGSAPFSDLEAVVGHESTVRIRRAVGYISDTVENESNGPASGNRTSEQQSTITSEQQTTKQEMADERLATLRKSANSHLETATTEPFDDLATTRYHLERAGDEYGWLVNRAKRYGDDDILEAARERQKTVKTQLDALSDVGDSLETAREPVVTDEEPTVRESASEADLETTRDAYEEVIETADIAGFETAELERELETVVGELERRRLLVGAVEEVAAELDHVPTLDEVTTRREIDVTAYRETFGSWVMTLEASNIDLETAIIEDLRDVQRTSDGALDETTYQRNGRYALSVLPDRCESRS